MFLHPRLTLQPSFSNGLEFITSVYLGDNVSHPAADRQPTARHESSRLDHKQQMVLEEILKFY